MDSFKLCLKLFLLLIAADAISAARNLHTHKSSLSFLKKVEGSRKGDMLEGIHGVRTYLQRYGYLRRSNTNNNNNVTTTNALLFDDELESAVKLYQKFSKLNVSGVLEAETLGQMSMHRCGVPDHFHNNGSNNNTHMGDNSLYAFFPGMLQWPYEKMHLYYGFVNDFPTEYTEAVAQALGTWAVNSRFSFSPATSVVDILISFERGDHGDGLPFDGPGGRIVAHAFAPTAGILHFNADKLWSVGSLDHHFDVESVALHELGHVLGLAHSSIKSSVMWPYLNSGRIKNRLDDDDIIALRELYG